MKRLLLLLAAFVALTPTFTNGAQTAHGKMWCLSLRFQRGNGPFDLYSLDLTTLTSGINRELAPLQYPSSPTHWSWFNLNDEIFDEEIPGTLNLNTPGFSDSDGDGFDDFFDVSKAVSAQTDGAYFFQFEGVVRGIAATWNRPADSAFGTCVLNLSGYGSFTHTFELIEYKGSLTYTPGLNTVSGSLDLVQTGNPDNTFQGPVEFTKSGANPSNVLTLQSLFLTNAFLQTLSLFEPGPFLRDTSLLTNYYGNVEFDDGDPNTGDKDYYKWMLSIDDLNDTDNDTIPDFSDNPQVALPRRPSLTLTRGPTNLWLAISGDVGHVHRILEAASLTSAGWFTNKSVQLTNDPQTVSLPLPSSGLGFLRVVAE